MALGVTERLRIIFDVETQSFKQGVKSLKADLAAADGAVAKSKVGLSAIGSQLKQFGGQALLAGGAIAVGFGVKAIQTVNETTLAIDKFATSTRMSLEEASKWKGVGDEVGVGLDTIQSAAVRMTSAVASGTFTKLGLEAQYAADGTLNVNETLVSTISTIGAMRSAEERNDAARRVFGRNFVELSRLMELSADDLYAKLESTPDWEITTEEDTKNAKEMQAALDAFGDAAGEVQYILARGLTPALTDTVEAINAVRDGAKDIGDTAEDALGSTLWNGITQGVTKEVKKWINPIGYFRDGINETQQALDQLADGDFGPVRESTEGASEAMSEWDARAQYVQSRMAALVNGTEVLADETDELAEATNAAADSNEAAARSAATLAEAQADLYDQLRESTDATITYEQSVIGLEQGVDAYRESLNAANEDGEVTREELLDLASTHNDLKQDVLDTASAFAESQGATEGSTRAAELQIEELERLKQKFPELASFIDGHIAKLNAIPKTINTQLNVIGVGVGGEGGSDAASGIRGGGAMPVGGGAPNSMAPSGLLQGALNFFANLVGGRGGVSSDDKPVPATRRERFDREFDLARRKYERGWYDGVEYREELQRLRRVYKFRPLSDPGMALFRELERVNADLEELTKPARGDKPASGDAPLPPRQPEGGPAGPSGGSGRAQRSSSGGSAGLMVNVTISAPNAAVVDGKAVRAAIPAFAAELRRFERGQG